MKNSEKRAKQLCRVGEILGMLIEREQCRRPELAEHFELSERTIQRDIDFLAVLFPVYYDREAESYVLDKNHSFKDINLAPEEIRALFMCRLIASNLGDSVSGAIDSLFKKLKVEMGKKSSETMEKVSAKYAFDGEPLEYISAAQKWLDVIQHALDKNLCIEITNADMEESIEIIDPYGLFIKAGRVCLVAYSQDKREVVVYAVHRIINIRQTNMSYQIPPSFTIDKFLKKNKEAVHKVDIDRLTWTLEWLDNTIEEFEKRRLIWTMSTIARIYQERISDLRQALEGTVEEIKRAENPLSFEKESIVIKSMERVLDGWERTKSAFEKTVQKYPLREFDDAIHDQFKKLREIDIDKEYKDILDAYEISLNNRHKKSIESFDNARAKLKDGTYDNELRAIDKTL